MNSINAKTKLFRGFGVIFMTLTGSAMPPAGSVEPPAAARPEPLGHCGGVTLVGTNLPPHQAFFEPASGNFQIVPTFNAGITAAQRKVMQQAIDEWNAIIQSRGFTPGNYPISFQYGALPAPKIGNTITTYNSNNGDLIRASMTIDPSYSWYEDPSPADDSEFSGPNPPAGFDLLTVVRHELGHAVGWAGTARETVFVANNVFDPSRLNISLVAGDPAHCDPAVHAGELMQPSIGGSTRRPIRLYPTAALLARSFQYEIPIRFVDSAYSGTETGTAWQPWRTFLSGADLAPPNVPLLLAPATLATLRNHNHAIPRTIFSARGGATVLGLTSP